MTGYSIENYDALKAAVNEWGEVHAPYEEVDYEVELRPGQVVWHDHDEAVSITQFGHIVDTYYFDRMVNPYCPQEYKHY